MTIVLRRYPVRTLTLVEPHYIRRDVFQEAEELLEQYMRKPILQEFGFGSGPDVEEKKNTLVVKGDLPEYKKGELDISVKGDTLTIKGERKEEKEKEGEGLYSYTSSCERYYREIPLPAHVDGKKSSFKLIKGKLEIKLPKAEKANNRQIKIKAQAPRKRQLKTAKAKSK